MPKTEVSFADVIGGLLKAQGTVCAICESPDRADIEAAREQGAPYSIIAQALQKLAVIDPNVTQDTATKRVRVHFTTPHQPKEA